MNYASVTSKENQTLLRQLPIFSLHENLSAFTATFNFQNRQCYFRKKNQVWVDMVLKVALTTFIVQLWAWVL